MKKIDLWLIAAITMVGPVTLAHPSWAESKSLSYTMSVTIPPIFELRVSGLEDGVLDFGPFDRDPLQPAQAASEEVTIRAITNMGQPYQILHKIAAPLTNEKGEAISPEDLTVNAQNRDTGGKAANNGHVSTAASALFTSNAQGKSDTVKASYQLKVRPEQASGTYQTQIVYSIVTL